MEYKIKITRVEKCYVKANNFDEALDKARMGDCECISLVSTFYEDVEEDDEDGSLPLYMSASAL